VNSRDQLAFVGTPFGCYCRKFKLPHLRVPRRQSPAGPYLEQQKKDVGPAVLKHAKAALKERRGLRALEIIG